MNKQEIVEKLGQGVTWSAIGYGLLTALCCYQMYYFAQGQLSMGSEQYFYSLASWWSNVFIIAPGAFLGVVMTLRHLKTQVLPSVS